MNMKQAVLLVLWVLGAGLCSAFAQTVAEDVLRDKTIQGIEFRNYEGPHRVIETRLAIQGIGADLGRQMQAEGATEADYGRKYRVVRLHDPSSDRLSADLFILEADAGVDHIRNLNWIVSAYLQQAFGYSATDADLLASFVTRYNAWYRGKTDYIAATYIPAVSAQVTAENAGLSLVWSEWPGKTKMLIPLRDSLSKGLGGSLNTEEVSNKDIVTQMASEPGRGLEERKKLADLKETEIVQEQRAVARAEADTPAAVVGTPQGTSPAVASPAAEATGSQKPAAPTTPATPSATEAVLPLAEAKKDLAARDQALQAERQDIVKQESQSVPETPAALVVKPASTTAFVRMTDGTKQGQLWLVDPSANTVWKKSELNTIRQNSAPLFGAGYLVVAGDSRGANGAVRLMLLSKDDASVLATGTEDVAPEASFLLQGKQVFALTKGEKGGWVLGLFDANLRLTARGTDPLTSLSAIVPTGSGLLVQGAGGRPLLVDEKTLKKKSDTEG